MRVICNICANRGTSFCKRCTWLKDKYPTQFSGRCIAVCEIPTLSKPINGLLGKDDTETPPIDIKKILRPPNE